MNDFMSVDMLATFTGLVTAVSIIVQFTKSAVKKKFSDYSVRIYTWIVSLILVSVFNDVDFTAKGILLTIINSIIIALTSMGTYEVIADPKAEKKREIDSL